MKGKIKKSVLCLSLALTTAATATSVGAAVNDNYTTRASKSVIYGDTDSDNTISITDATLIQKYIAGKVTMNNSAIKASDVTADNSVSIDDATTIQKKLADVSVKGRVGESIKVIITIYFSNSDNWTGVSFIFSNSVSGKSTTVVGSKYNTNDFGEKVYYTDVDINEYDRVVFSNGVNKKTCVTSLCKASSGFYAIAISGTKTQYQTGTYAYTGSDSGTLKTTTLQYSSGYNKKIWVWTPAGYDKTRAKKYKTVYIMDGQNLFSDHSDGYGGWGVCDAVESMMSNGEDGVIIVGIDNGNAKRDSELTPDLGNVKPAYKSEFSSRTGKAFSDFVVNTVMPYVQSNYNSSTSAEDNCIAGSSSGGLESFYIGMEHYDKFGSIGALSPAFVLFDWNVWNSYLSKFNLKSDKMPMLYIYNGNYDSLEKELLVDSVEMFNKLTKEGYDSSKIKLSVEQGGSHNEAYWRVIFPEMLTWCYGY